MLWIGLTLFYGVVKGVREIVKKKSFEKSTLMEVLFFYTLIGFVMLLPTVGSVGGMKPELYGFVALKSFIIFVAWLCGFKAVKEIPISVYGVLDLSRVLFSTLLGVFVLHETLQGNRIVGLVLVAAGLIALRFEKPWRRSGKQRRRWQRRIPHRKRRKQMLRVKRIPKRPPIRSMWNRKKREMRFYLSSWRFCPLY